MEAPAAIELVVGKALGGKLSVEVCSDDETGVCEVSSIVMGGKVEENISASEVPVCNEFVCNAGSVDVMPTAKIGNEFGV